MSAVGQIDPVASLAAQQAPVQAPQGMMDPVQALAMGQSVAVPQPAAQAVVAPNTQSTLADVIRSIPGGVAKGVAGIAGLPGDVSQFLDAGMDKLTGANVANAPHPLRVTSGDINSTISQPFGGYYQPQTVPGQYAETAASFAPNAVAPGTMAQKLARVLIPAATSETAGQATKGTPAEPVARALGAVLGGVGEGAGEAGIARAQNPAPSLDDLAQAKAATYKAADDAGVVISPQSFQQFATDAGVDLTKNNVVQTDLHPQTMTALKVLQEEAASGVPISLERADKIRQAIGTAAESAAGPNGNNGDLRLVQQVKTGLDNYLDNLTPADTLSGDPSTAVPILKDARALAQKEFKGKQIQQLIDLAQNSASTNYSASGYEQALRAQFKNFNAKLIKDPNLASTFSPDEQAAIQKVAQGGPVGNALRFLGKFSAHGPVGTAASVGLGAMLGSHVGGAEGAGAGGMAGALMLPAIGEAARSGATAITSKNAAMAAELMRRGTALPTNNAATKTGLASLLLSQVGH